MRISGYKSFMDEHIKKKVRAILLMIAAVFVIYNIIWFIYVYKVYSPFVDALGKDRYAQVDGYEYYVAIPHYLSFTGNLTAGESNKNRDIYNETSVSLIIWPRFDGTYKVHARVETPKVKEDEFSSSSAIYGFDLNGDLKPDLSDKDYNEHKEFFDENYEKIEDVLVKAQSTFNIDLK